MRHIAVGLMYNLRLRAESAQPALELRCSRPIEAQGQLGAASSPWQLVASLGPAWLDSLLPWQPSTQALAIEARKREPELQLRQGKKKKKQTITVSVSLVLSVFKGKKG